MVTCMSPSTPDKKNISGLSQVEAALRLASEGPNELPTAGKRQLWRITIEVLREPMFLLLVSAGTIFLLLGEINDALMLPGFVSLLIGVTILPLLLPLSLCFASLPEWAVSSVSKGIRYGIKLYESIQIPWVKRAKNRVAEIHLNRYYLAMSFVYLKMKCTSN